MQNQITSLFTSYDVFGKSVPGAVLLLGLLSLIPRADWSTSTIEIQPRNFAIILLVALFLGLVFGQAVHTLADNIEKIFSWVENRLTSAPGFLKNAMPELHEQISYERQETVDLKVSYLSYVTRMWKAGIVGWLERRYWGLHSTFKSHRRYFADSCEWEFSYEIGPRRFDEPKDIYSRFYKACGTEFGIEMKKLEADELEQIYPLITSYLSKKSGTQYRQFQAIYSFCRSMWVVLLILAFGYSLPYFVNLIPVAFSLGDYVPLGLEIIPKSTRPLLAPFLLTSSILFMDAAGTYKRHYVEYLISDFCMSHSESTRSEEAISYGS